MGAFTQNAEILAGGTDYMWIVTVFSLGLFMSVTMERVLQVTGKTVYQMISQMTGAVVNIILDPVFIFGWLGLPAMGVAGAAWATVIGQFCGMAVGIGINHVKTMRCVSTSAASGRTGTPSRASIRWACPPSSCRASAA